MNPLGPVVQLWLSTEDRKLRLARQPDIETDEDAASSADVVIDTRNTYQSIVGFGAALTDSLEYALWKSGAGVRRRDERSLEPEEVTSR